MVHHHQGNTARARQNARHIRALGGYYQLQVLVRTSALDMLIYRPALIVLLLTATARQTWGRFV